MHGAHTSSIKSQYEMPTFNAQGSRLIIVVVHLMHRVRDYYSNCTGRRSENIRSSRAHGNGKTG
jgi:hypothetical protein